MSQNDRSVYKRKKDGLWANKKDNASKPASLHKTQKEAENEARTNLKNQGGGELKTMGRNGRIRSKDTIGKKDPFPPRDKEN
jgi:hypothetical protein